MQWTGRGALWATLTSVTILTAAVAAQSGGWRADPAIVAQLSKGQPDTLYDEDRVPAYTLPDPLKTAGGRTVASATDWPARRREILDLFREHVYGRSPGAPDRLQFRELEVKTDAMDGAATLRRVAIDSAVGQRTHTFELTLFLPNAVKGPAPVFLLINNRPASNTDPTRKEKSGFWPAEEMIARGYGIAAIQYGQLAPDDTARFRDGAIALFEGGSSGARPPHAWGAIAAWAWGASRALDYLVSDARVDAKRVAVVGHSRGGKAALWAGAEDERFALVVSNESGESGAALSRRMYGETIARITATFPHWFTGRYAGYSGREAELPVDQHLLLSLIAPRPLYVASANEDLWADPRGEFLSLAATSPVYALWREPGLAADQMPALDSPFVAGRRGYHVRSGTHNLTPYDWTQFASFADRVWAGSAGR
jgi:hypothetical protein